MKNRILTLLLTMVLSTAVFAQNHTASELDGTELEYQYENGSEVHAEFVDGNYHFRWITGPYAGISGKVPYKAVKVDRKKYAINFYVASHASYVTLVLDFRKRKLIGSALIHQQDQVIQSIDIASISKAIRDKVH